MHFIESEKRTHMKVNYKCRRVIFCIEIGAFTNIFLFFLMVPKLCCERYLSIQSLLGKEKKNK